MIGKVALTWKLGLLTLLGLLLVSCGMGQTKQEDPKTPETTVMPTMQEFTDPDEEAVFAPDFTLTSIEGESISLSDFEGQWVMLNFWATWCKPCVAEMPVLQEIADTHLDLVLLGINVREPDDLVQAFLEENGITYAILMTPNSEQGNAVLIDYQALSLPQSVIIAPNGEMMWRKFGELELDSFTNTLNQVIAEWNKANTFS